MFYQLEDGENDEDFGSPEPLCRQSLSLVYSTIEENYPEGTLQLLGDFIQPRYYPPVAITSHLLRGIFLDTQSSYVLAIDAYNLLMKIQRYCDCTCFELIRLHLIWVLTKQNEWLIMFFYCQISPCRQSNNPVGLGTAVVGYGGKGRKTYIELLHNIYTARMFNRQRSTLLPVVLRMTLRGYGPRFAACCCSMCCRF